ncbi:MAG: class I tRNA ligase family protein, partial [Opitutaceae bacterium]
ASAARKSEIERADQAREKSGVFTGSYALNPLVDPALERARLPIFAADYVLATYGTGAIMAVPGHDERDFEFARKFDLPIPRVIAPADGSDPPLPFCDKGGDVRLVNSGDCDGLTPAEAKEKLDARFSVESRGRATIQFKLRDWLFSRQRYWGEPFPVVWVNKADYDAAVAACGDSLPLPPEPVDCLIEGEQRFALPLPESALPLELPEVATYQPTGTGESPLAAITPWLEIWHQPATGKAVPASEPQPAADRVRARRETNTMPQWAGSCWYYLRYLDPSNDRAIASPEALRYWGGPDIYVGGAEHAVLHLLYARFWHKVLFDLGVVPFDEPFKKLFHQGIILGEDGEKMSKSRGNVANPDDLIRDYGTDTLRLYLMFLGPLEAMKPWNPKGIEGVHRFLRGIWREIVGEDGGVNPKIVHAPEAHPETDRLLHATIKKVTEDIEGLRYNTAISQMMIFRNHIQKVDTMSIGTARALVQLVAPFAPHMAEELWERLGGTPSVVFAPWPVFDPAKLLSKTVKLVIQINGRMRGDVMIAPDAPEAEALALARANEKLSTHLDGKALRKIIYVPGRILNLVVGES